jgi:protein-S-isoprenylcysteine O-methyltransferase Ste14
MTDFIEGFFAPWIIYAFIILLHLVLPARKVVGYVVNPATKEPWRYRLNGPLVLAVTVGAWALVGGLGALPWDWLWTHRWSGLIGACVLGLVFSFAIVLSARPTGRHSLADFFFGRTENIQFFGGRVDAKMTLYLVGAVMLAVNVLSFGAHHVVTYGGSASVGVYLYGALFLWFVTEYLVFERVHLYTYDLFAERVGFKLGWGCLTFYPYFYAVGLWFAAELPSPGTPTWLLVLSAVVFFTGWTLTRGANMQKFHFKLDRSHVFLGILQPQVVKDGTQALLCSGFWGVARHVNYLGEILQAIGLTLALGRPELWPAWLYPAYYVAMLLPRERDDEKRCARKYGALWAAYTRRVPRRIIPFLY